MKRRTGWALTAVFALLVLFEDGICGGLNFSYTGTPGQDSDIYCNLITHATDDLIEADGGGMNVRIWGNYLAHGLRFISLQNLPLGPVYIFRNIFGPQGDHLTTRQMPSPFKFLSNERGGDPWIFANYTPFNGPVYFYHNSLVVDDFPSAFALPGGGHLRHLVSRNNIFLTSRHFLHDPFTDDSRDHRPPPYNVDFVECSFDYDLHNQESSGDSVAASLGGHNIKAGARWRPGHGPAAEVTGRYQLAEDAPGRNAGTPLPNFNLGTREEGEAPDVGAHEFNSPDLAFGINARWDVP